MAEKVAETWITTPKRLVSAGSRDACIVHIYPTGPQMGCRYPLTDKNLLLGRGDDCDVRIQDNSVSRRHATVQPAPEGFYVLDHQSTNGSFVNDTQIAAPHLLHDGDYLRIGNCIYRYLAGGNVEAEYHEEIYRLTIMDALTQTYNQRYLLEFLERELVRAVRHARPLTLLMFDIDRFKAVNDDLGHLAGDFSLRELAGVIREGVRREDLFARYGGEEFALVLVESTKDQAVEVADRIRASVAKHPFRFENQTFHITVSIGVADVPFDEQLSVAELIRRADEKLYQAKRAGRNRIVS
jgi:diguanylate cyclase (GGDEF)-like protein